ncbi:hypothetical protein [Micromonospora sp. NBC_01796]|uniref:hypothetical protein n=1 Tax=Micromonospora sp. NBC_01796 TaxID=2975987 RepID=UPI002DD87053|nr:hypothetical protein [Micromonospora sp. NBC_01796]WSA86470.1 hypothetical protein OIE47_02270 [Micromonospora sp. NBC_01796]
MKLLKTLAIAAATTAMLVLGVAGPAHADATAYNDYGTATFTSNGDYFVVTQFEQGQFPEPWATYAEWYTSYGRTGECGDTIGGRIGCNEDVAENRYITIRVCTRYGFYDQSICGGWRTSAT